MGSRTSLETAMNEAISPQHAAEPPTQILTSSQPSLEAYGEKVSSENVQSKLLAEEDRDKWLRTNAKAPAQSEDLLDTVLHSGESNKGNQYPSTSSPSDGNPAPTAPLLEERTV